MAGPSPSEPVIQVWQSRPLMPNMDRSSCDRLVWHPPGGYGSPGFRMQDGASRSSNVLWPISRSGGHTAMRTQSRRAAGPQRDWRQVGSVVDPLTSDDPREVAGYQLRARLGAGGMGRVYLAFTHGGRPVAIKVVRAEFGDDEEFKGRFRLEVAAAQRVHGLYTAQVLDADPDARLPWLATAYVPGLSLQQAVADHGPLPPDSVFLLLAGIAEALQAIHAVGIVHRDLKPSNVILAADGPRVIDFGIAQSVAAPSLTRGAFRIGSPRFMAPEQARGQLVTPAVDVFALGSLATYAIAGRPPFGVGGALGVLYRVLNDAPDLGGCPADLRPLIERCLAKDPAQRPP